MIADKSLPSAGELIGEVIPGESLDGCASLGLSPCSVWLPSEEEESDGTDLCCDSTPQLPVNSRVTVPSWDVAIRDLVGGKARATVAIELYGLGGSGSLQRALVLLGDGRWSLFVKYFRSGR